MREYLSHSITNALILTTGALFALICLLIIVVEYIIKVITIPAMLLFGIGVLAADHLKKIHHA